MKTGTVAVTSLEIRANGFDLLSRLADDLAHELKNPVHAAVINLELIRRRIAAQRGDDALDRVRILEAQVARVHELSDWVLRVLRPSGPSTHVSQLDHIVSELLPLIEVIGGLNAVDIHYEPAGNAALVVVSEAALRHVMLNLTVNALDALRPAGGRLGIVGSCAADEVRLRFTDSGPGVPAEIVDRVGTPGFTTRPGRAGLGLAVAHALMQEAGGSVELESAGGAGEGASFALALPLAAGA